MEIDILIISPLDELPLEVIKQGESQTQARARLVLSVLQNVYGTADTYRLGFDHAYWVNLFNAGRIFSALALLGNNAIGTHSVFQHSNDWESLRAVVQKEYRGKGIGKVLFEKCMTHIESRKTNKLSIYSYLRASDPCEQALHINNKFNVMELISKLI